MISNQPFFSGSEETNALAIAALSGIGERSQQQDCFGYLLNEKGGIIVVADGMGGHKGGQMASKTVVEVLMQEYLKRDPSVSVSDFLKAAITNADQTVGSFQTLDGSPVNAGSTVVAVVIENGNFYWLSIGDSRIYLIRGEECVRVTQDQIYRVVLDDKLRRGEISIEEYNQEIPKGDALICYVGIGNLYLTDGNTVPFPLLPGDRLLLTSDGIYKYLSDDEIRELSTNFTDPEESLRAMELKVSANARRNRIDRDNMTAVLVRIKETEDYYVSSQM